MHFTVDRLKAISYEMFDKMGASEEEARTMTEELVKSNLTGTDSHGVLRILDYWTYIKQGRMFVRTDPVILRENESTFVMDMKYGFGHYGMVKMADLAAQKAKKTGVACGVSIHTNHIGRLGSYTDMLADRGLVSMLMVGGYAAVPMCPFGGIEHRLTTNPYSWGAPRKNGPNIMLDMATTAVAEGKVRFYYQSGKQVPLGWVRDADGNDTVDPSVIYKKDEKGRYGSILPAAGQKGYGMAIFANIFGCALAGKDYWPDHDFSGKVKKDGYNGPFLLVVDPDKFFGLENFKELVESMAVFIKSSAPAPGFDEVLLPGEPEYRTMQKRLKEGVEVPEGTLKSLYGVGQELGCEWINDLDGWVPDMTDVFKTPDLDKRK